jgi:NADH:ubiquinone oxidoreductase subunit E
MNRVIETLSAEEFKKVDQIITKYKGRHRAVISVLKETQDICRYFLQKVQHRFAKDLHLSSPQVFGLVSFYLFFTTIPMGKDTIQGCPRTACYVKGLKRILDNLRRKLNVEVGGITKNRKFSLEAVRYLGAW